VEVARAAAPQAAHKPVVSAEAGPLSEVVPSAEVADVPDDRWVWYIFLFDGGPLSGQGTFVILDYFDGRVYEVVDIIS